MTDEELLRRLDQMMHPWALEAAKRIRELRGKYFDCRMARLDFDRWKIERNTPRYKTDRQKYVEDVL